MLKDYWKKLILLSAAQFQALSRQMIPLLEKLKVALAQESEETKEMLQIYNKQVRGEASEEEIKKANAQFVDLIKATGLGVIIFLPFSVVTIPFFVKLGRKLGVEILPSSLAEEKLHKKK